MGQTLEAIEIGGNQDLLQLVEAANEQGAPVILRRGGEDVAVLMPVRPRAPRRPRHHLSAEEIAAFRSAAAGWADIDTDKLIADIYESRRQSIRPPIDL